VKIWEKFYKFDFVEICMTLTTERPSARFVLFKPNQIRLVRAPYEIQVLGNLKKRDLGDLQDVTRFLDRRGYESYYAMSLTEGENSSDPYSVISRSYGQHNISGLSQSLIWSASEDGRLLVGRKEFSIRKRNEEDLGFFCDHHSGFMLKRKGLRAHDIALYLMTAEQFKAQVDDLTKREQS